MTITELTREMISDYETLIGRKLTPQEYIQFRGQAMLEIQNGFGTNIQSIPIPPQTAQVIPVVTEQAIVTETEKIKEGSAPVLEPAKTTPKKTEPKKVEKKVLVETNKTVAEEDPFFALIDKMDA